MPRGMSLLIKVCGVLEPRRAKGRHLQGVREAEGEMERGREGGHRGKEYHIPALLRSCISSKLDGLRSCPAGAHTPTLTMPRRTLMTEWSKVILTSAVLTPAPSKALKGTINVRHGWACIFLTSYCACIPLSSNPPPHRRV